MTEERNDFGRIQIQPLTAENYYVWSNDIEVFLRGKGLWSHAVGTARSPTDPTQVEKYERGKDMCLAYLLMTIEQSCKFAVIGLRDPKEVWDNLKETYQKVSESLIDSKLTQLQEISMETSESVVQYSNRIERLSNESLYWTTTVGSQWCDS